LTQIDFIKLFENVCDGSFDTQKVLVEKLELSLQGNMVYKDDLKNPIFERLTQLIKEMKKPPGKK
jgi:hypothetical protein